MLWEYSIDVSEELKAAVGARAPGYAVQTFCKQNKAHSYWPNQLMPGPVDSKVSYIPFKRGGQHKLNQ